MLRFSLLSQNIRPHPQNEKRAPKDPFPNTCLSLTDLSAEPFVLRPDEAFGMRVDVGAARTRKGRERHPAAFGRSHGERRGGRNGKEDLDAAHGGLLDHLVGGAGAHDERAVPPALARAKAEELVERHVAANVLGAARGRAVQTEAWVQPVSAPMRSKRFNCATASR